MKITYPPQVNEQMSALVFFSLLLFLLLLLPPPPAPACTVSLGEMKWEYVP